jgi:hypothetical protein
MTTAKDFRLTLHKKSLALNAKFSCAKSIHRDKLDNDDLGFLFLMKRSQEAHSWSTQQLRWFRQEQKDKPECSSSFMHVPDWLPG